MRSRNTLRNRGAIVAGTAAVAVFAAMSPAFAQRVGPDPKADDWGNVVPGAGCAQANSWIASVKGLAQHVDTKLFETHSPPTPNAPESRGGGKDLVNLTLPGGIGLGVVSALHNRALANKLPGNPGQPDVVPSPCSAYSDAGAATVDVGLPYIANPTPGGTQLSPFGVHVGGIQISATATPGQPVKLDGGAAEGYISTFGHKIVSIPKLWPTNFGVRIPADRSQPPLVVATTNEQVTTDAKGHPTLDKKGHYFLDPTASSGYVNAIHASVLGTNGADAILGHVAALTSGPAPQAPAPAPAPGGSTAPQTGDTSAPAPQARHR